MSGKHISSQFDSELNAISTRVMEMGGVVELQLRTAIAALSDMDVEAADNVIELETEVNNFELELDHDISSIIGRRQPTARDYQGRRQGGPDQVRGVERGGQAARQGRGWQGAGPWEGGACCGRGIFGWGLDCHVR
ncbi:MAG: hypothetical protein NWQ22_07255, partial [Burkholderiaceae bacterium]|nr:hypothetical protein [Burkholderiaceae bacterium]